MLVCCLRYFETNSYFYVGFCISKNHLRSNFTRSYVCRCVTAWRISGERSFKAAVRLRAEGPYGVVYAVVVIVVEDTPPPSRQHHPGIIIIAPRKRSEEYAAALTLNQRMLAFEMRCLIVLYHIFSCDSKSTAFSTFQLCIPLNLVFLKEDYIFQVFCWQPGHCYSFLLWIFGDGNLNKLYI